MGFMLSSHEASLQSVKKKSGGAENCKGSSLRCHGSQFQGDCLADCYGNVRYSTIKEEAAEFSGARACVNYTPEKHHLTSNESKSSRYEGK